MVPISEGEEYKHHSSSLFTARAMIKGEGFSVNLSWSDPSVEKEICAPILASRSLPIRGLGSQAGKEIHVLLHGLLTDIVEDHRREFGFGYLWPQSYNV